MSMTDPIADFLSRIRNGIRARKQLVECPRSNLKLRLAEILRDEGFLQGVVSTDDDKQGMLKLSLRYDGRPTGAGSAITGMRRVSRPGQRAYVPAKQVPRVRNGLGIAILSTSQGVMAKQVPRVRNGLGIAILSTSQGVMTDKEARNKGVGGEVLCEVW